jgi:hypothetical protein
MAPADSILRLFQLHPFPLPFTDTHFLMPDPTNQILALSSGSDWLSMEMSAINLMGCHGINTVYLCERHGVLKCGLNSTCLGSLYVQDFNGATSLCEMDIVPQVETVLQLQDNWYLVYSPRSFTSYISCLNSTNSETFICHGANRIFVSPSCRLQLRSHVLISDFLVQMDAIIKHYQWELDQVAFTPEEQSCSAEWQDVLDREQVGNSTLSSIRQSLAVECRSSIWLYTYIILGSLAAVLLAVIICYVVLTLHLVTWRKHIIDIVRHILPEPVLRLMTPPAPSAPEVQPM